MSGERRRETAGNRRADLRSQLVTLIEEESRRGIDPVTIEIGPAPPTYLPMASEAEALRMSTMRIRVRGYAVRDREALLVELVFAPGTPRERRAELAREAGDAMALLLDAVGEALGLPVEDGRAVVVNRHFRCDVGLGCLYGLERFWAEREGNHEVTRRIRGRVRPS